MNLIIKNKKTILLLSNLTLIVILLTTTTVEATFVEMEKIHRPTKEYYKCDEIIQFNLTLTVLTEKDGSVLSIKDLKIVDTLPPGLEFLPGNRTSTPAAVNFTNYMNGTLVWDFGPGPFTTAPQANIRFNVTVTSDAPENVYQQNKAEAFYIETPSNVPSNPAVTDVVKVIYPILDINKTCTGTTREGGDILYTIQLKNTGHLDATNISVIDQLPSGVIYTPGSAITTSGTIDETQLPNLLIWNGNIGNVTGINTVNITIPVSDDPGIISPTLINNASYTGLSECEKTIKTWDTCETQVINPDINLLKDCMVSSIVEPSNITYTYTVTNTGNTPLTDVYVYDETLDQLILGPINLDIAEFALGEYILYDKQAGVYLNTANATGMDMLGGTVTDHDAAECEIQAINPNITLVKECNVSSIEEPSDITYTFNVTNTGNVPLTDVYVYDETLDIQILGPITLDPAESSVGHFVLYNQSAGIYSNTANATGRDSIGNIVEDHDDSQCAILEASIQPGLVGGEIYPIITDAQRLVIILGTITLLVVMYMGKKRF